MDKFTFGKTKASEVLIDILKTQPSKINRIVSSTFHETCYGFKAIETAKFANDSFRRTLLILWWKNADKTVAEKLWPVNIKTHLRTCIRAQYRDVIRNHDKK